MAESGYRNKHPAVVLDPTRFERERDLRIWQTFRGASSSAHPAGHDSIPLLLQLYTQELDTKLRDKQEVIVASLLSIFEKPYLLNRKEEWNPSTESTHG